MDNLLYKEKDERFMIEYVKILKKYPIPLLLYCNNSYEVAFLPECTAASRKSKPIDYNAKKNKLVTYKKKDKTSKL